MLFPYLATAGDTHECDDDIIFAEFVDLSDTSICHLGHKIDLGDCLQAYKIVKTGRCYCDMREDDETSNPVTRSKPSYTYTLLGRLSITQGRKPCTARVA